MWWLVESGVTAWIRAAAPRGPRTHSRAAAVAAVPVAAARESPGTGSGGSRAAARRPPACLPARQPRSQPPPRPGRQRPHSAPRGPAAALRLAPHGRGCSSRGTIDSGSPGLGFICNVQHISHAHKAGGKGGGAGKRPLPVVPGLGVEAMFVSPAGPWPSGLRVLAGPPAAPRGPATRPAQPSPPGGKSSHSLCKCLGREDSAPRLYATVLGPAEHILHDVAIKSL